jgi:hypothetical protein
MSDKGDKEDGELKAPRQTNEVVDAPDQVREGDVQEGDKLGDGDVNEGGLPGDK